MKPHGKPNSGTERASRIARGVGIVGAAFLVILLNGCCSLAGSGGPDPSHYNPVTGYPAVGTWPWSP